MELVLRLLAHLPSTEQRRFCREIAGVATNAERAAAEKERAEKVAVAEKAAAKAAMMGGFEEGFWHSWHQYYETTNNNGCFTHSGAGGTGYSNGWMYVR